MSLSANAVDTLHTLIGNEEPDKRLAAPLHWLADRLRKYPNDQFIPPMRPPKKRPEAVAIYAIDLGADPAARPLLRIVGKDAEVSVSVPDAASLAAVLFSARYRGAYLVAWRLTQGFASVLLQDYAIDLCNAGYTIDPVGLAGRLRLLVVRKGGHVWRIVDAEGLTGIDADNPAQFCRKCLGDFPSTGSELGDLQWACDQIQHMTLTEIKARFRATIGLTALDAAGRALPSDIWLWRPPPFLVTMCRDGGAFRGGYVYADTYRGNAWLSDVARMYTWAASFGLPARAALGRFQRGGAPGNGIYLCEITGTPALPLYLSVWEGDLYGFQYRMFRGGACLAILPTAEIPGIVALGCQVRPGVGYEFVMEFGFETLSEKLAELAQRNGGQTPVGRLAKRVGNALYGKLAERSERQELRYSRVQPGDEWRPMLTSYVEEIPYLWTRESVVYRRHQQIGIATTITGRARAKTYQGAAAIIAAGGRVAHVDTDSIISTVDPTMPLRIGPQRPGAWKLVGYDPDAIIAGSRAFSLAATTQIAGFQDVTRDMVSRLHAGGKVRQTIQLRGNPWQGVGGLRIAERG